MHLSQHEAWIQRCRGRQHRRGRDEGPLNQLSDLALPGPLELLGIGRWARQFRAQYGLLRDGEIGWGWISDAHYELVDPGRHDEPALIVFGLEPWDDGLDELKALSERLAEQPPALSPGVPEPVDHPITKGRAAWIARLLVYRKHLPRQRLSSPWVPMLVSGRRHRAMILPYYDVWPADMVKVWSGLTPS